MSVEKFNEGFGTSESVPFTIVANIVVQNLIDPPALSIWIYLQSLPGDWKIHKTHLRRHFGFGEKKLEKALSLLVKCRLLEYVRIRSDDGSFTKGFWRALNGSQFIHPDSFETYTTTTPKTHRSGNPPPCEKGVHTKETVITNEIKKQNAFFENDSVNEVSNSDFTQSEVSPANLVKSDSDTSIYKEQNKQQNNICNFSKKNSKTKITSEIQDIWLHFKRVMKVDWGLTKPRIAIIKSSLEKGAPYTDKPSVMLTIDNIKEIIDINSKDTYMIENGYTDLTNFLTEKRRISYVEGRLQSSTNETNLNNQLWKTIK